MKSMIRTRNRFLIAALATAVFAGVYELFSHQVYSNALLFAFLIPLLGGALPYSLLVKGGERFRPSILAECLYCSGLASLTAGSVFRGILEIYGTTSRLCPVYWIAGGLFTGLGLLLFLLTGHAPRNKV